MADDTGKDGTGGPGDQFGAHGPAPGTQAMATQHMQHILVSQPLRGFDVIEPRALLPILAKPFYRDQLLSILRAGNMLNHYGVICRLKDFVRIPQLIAQLHGNCDYVLSVCTEALRLAQAHLLVAEGTAAYELKANVHARWSDVSLVPEMVHTNLRGINFSAAGDTFLQLSGLVTSVGAARLIPRRRIYKCSHSSCGYEFTVNVSLEYNNEVRLPSLCPNPDLIGQGKAKRKCQNREFIPPVLSGAQGGTYESKRPDGAIIRTALHTDYQELVLQERLESLGETRSAPRTITIVLENDLVNSMSVGTDVVVTGKLVNKIFSYQPGQRAIREPVLLANHVRNTSSKLSALASNRSVQDLHADFLDYWSYWKAVGRPVRGRDILVRSMAPDLHGMYGVKLALLLVLIGGCDGLGNDPDYKQDAANEGSTAGEGWLGPADDAEGAPAAAQVRGFCHMLLVGDPGTGKSQLMRFVLDLIPRSIMTTGVSSSAAGLTCTAVREKDGGGFRLEAGALVLADRGVCCVDEFSTLKKDERGAVLEAMEHGYISVAKAGIITKLPTRCTVLGACNPRASTKSKKTGGYDWQAADLTLLTGIESPLLSRFDLVLLLPDPHTEGWDMAMSGFILSRAAEQGLAIHQDHVRECEERLHQSLLSRTEAQQRAGLSQVSIVLGETAASQGGSQSLSLAEAEQRVQEAQEAVDRAREHLWVETEMVRKLNDASGISSSRYLLLGVDPGRLCDEGGDRKADRIALETAMIAGGTTDTALAQVLTGLMTGSAQLHGNRFSSGRRIEDLLVSQASAGAGAGDDQALAAAAAHPSTASNMHIYASMKARASLNRAPSHSIHGVDVRWSMVRLQAYIAHVQEKFRQVLICEEGIQLLRSYYDLQRGSDVRSQARTTVRMLQGLIRLTQAHARLMFRGTATVQDACVAISVMEYSAMANGSQENNFKSVGQTEFPGDPDVDYAWRERRVVTRLLLSASSAHGMGSGAGQEALTPDQCQEISKKEQDREQYIARAAGGHVKAVTGEDIERLLLAPPVHGAGGGHIGTDGLDVTALGRKRSRVAAHSTDDEEQEVTDVIAGSEKRHASDARPGQSPAELVRASHWAGKPGPVRHGTEQARESGFAIPGENRFFATTAVQAQARGRIDENSPYTPAAALHAQPSASSDRQELHSTRQSALQVQQLSFSGSLQHTPQLGSQLLRSQPSVVVGSLPAYPAHAAPYAVPVRATVSTSTGGASQVTAGKGIGSMGPPPLSQGLPRPSLPTAPSSLVGAALGKAHGLPPAPSPVPVPGPRHSHSSQASSVASQQLPPPWQASQGSVAGGSIVPGSLPPTPAGTSSSSTSTVVAPRPLLAAGTAATSQRLHSGGALVSHPPFVPHATAGPQAGVTPGGTPGSTQGRPRMPPGMMGSSGVKPSQGTAGSTPKAMFEVNKELTEEDML